MATDNQTDGRRKNNRLSDKTKFQLATWLTAIKDQVVRDRLGPTAVTKMANEKFKLGLSLDQVRHVMEAAEIPICPVPGFKHENGFTKTTAEIKENVTHLVARTDQLEARVKALEVTLDAMSRLAAETNGHVPFREARDLSPECDNQVS